MITIGLVLDIIGVTLLLAGPRVHPRSAEPLRLRTGVVEDTWLRRTWSRFGPYGLPTVVAGFTLQILGVWADDLSWPYLGPLFGLVPLVFFVSLRVVRKLPRGE